MKVYVAGPMTGQPNHGFAAFDQAEAALTAAGFDVVSPARIDREMGWVEEVDGEVRLTDRFDYTAALNRDFFEIACCDAIVLLPGWEHSNGATRELIEAQRLGLAIFNSIKEICSYVEVIR